MHSCERNLKHVAVRHLFWTCPSTSASLPGLHGASGFDGYNNIYDFSASCWIPALLCCGGVLAARTLNPFTIMRYFSLLP